MRLLLPIGGIGSNGRDTEVHYTEEGMMSEPKREKSESRLWEPMKITFAGDAGELLKTGEGKTSPSPQDPGETFQPPGGQP
jgi:hypothetical protein